MRPPPPSRGSDVQTHAPPVFLNALALDDRKKEKKKWGKEKKAQDERHKKELNSKDSNGHDREHRSAAKKPSGSPERD